MASRSLASSVQLSLHAPNFTIKADFSFPTPSTPVAVLAFILCSPSPPFLSTSQVPPIARATDYSSTAGSAVTTTTPSRCTMAAVASSALEIMSPPQMIYTDVKDIGFVVVVVLKPSTTFHEITPHDDDYAHFPPFNVVTTF
ncbi:hypothetical protein IW261DRAFT_1573866 [Armillaria novae-zelandiae]|uniref:Uncharacterized protein n=1 Tax=Armillaria novae-zelandiae TaxID=153914 RepID=A0AA39NL05_9AGAR|nr:hypothetical protein IW261DRAFT_1573866 [Armillaria novae-zelandiae]